MDRSFDLALLGRFIAICIAAATAYVLRSELQIGYAALAIVGASAILNFGVYWLSPTRFSRFRRRASPVVGVVCWAALMSVTGGIGSLFIAGLSMEIVLAMVSLSPLGVLVVSAGAALALVAQQAVEGYRGVAYALTLHGTFMLVIGLVTAWIARRWRRAEGEFVSQSAELGTRLDSVERELADERTLSQMGERAARLAHGLKNAVHSLRGFASLIEPKLSSGNGLEALAGLRSAIDDLEALARLTLDADAETFAGSTDGATGQSAGVSSHAEAPRRIDTRSNDSSTGEPELSSVHAAVERALSEMSVSQPNIEWRVESEPSLPCVQMSADSIAEALLILMRNASDAMAGEGVGALRVGATSGRLHVEVRDQGCGLSPDEIERLFTPGYTTKPGGSGFGLFLARRLVEEHGGELSISAAPGGGAVAAFSLPLRGEAPASDPATRLARA
jgi:signal transduction histidine kinase